MKEFEKKVENKSDDNSELIINYLKNSSEKKQLFRFDNPKFISI